MGNRRSGNDLLDGRDGNDTLNGGGGIDTLIGGLGNDTYIVDTTTDTLTENLNEGTDTVQSSVTYTLGNNLENLTLTGTAAIKGTGNALNNVLLGNSGKNTLTGLTGDDTLNGGTGIDTLIGGLGNDTYIVDTTTDTLTENLNEGTDTVQSSVTYTLSKNLENLTLTGTAAINGTGNTLNNVLTGNSANNILNGGTGTDTLIGGLGNDTYIVDTTTDTLTENLNEGTDTVQSSVTYTLGNNLENLTLTGSAAIDGFGNVADNQIMGNTAANSLDGRAGSDTVDGGGGDDRGIYRPSVNLGDTDSYKGNVGSDTLSLEFTHAELNNAQVQTDIRAYEEFLRLNANPVAATGPDSSSPLSG